MDVKNTAVKTGITVYCAGKLVAEIYEDPDTRAPFVYLYPDGAGMVVHILGDEDPKIIRNHTPAKIKEVE